MNPTRNIFFSYDHDDQMRPIAPCRTIPITDAIRRADAEKQAARAVKITWTPRLSDPSMKQAPKPKAHEPAKQPRRPRVCARCGHRPGGCVCAAQGVRKCSRCPSKLGFRNQRGVCRVCLLRERQGPPSERWKLSKCQACDKKISRGAVHKDVCRVCRRKREVQA